MNMTRNRVLMLFLLLFCCLGVSTLQAAPVVIDDNYVGATPTHSRYSGDQIGSEFGVETLTVDYDRESGSLALAVAGNYFEAGNLFKYGTTLGDIFISDDGWDPYGDAPYTEDNALTGEAWEYALLLDDHGATSGALSLVSLASATILHSNEFDHIVDLGYAYRKHQEVRVDPANLAALASGTWSVQDGELRAGIETGGLFGQALGLGFHWTMDCGNDVIEGYLPTAPTTGGEVPEPAAALLVALAAGAMVAWRRRNR